MSMKGFRTLHEAEAWLISGLKYNHDHADSFAKNQDLKNQEDMILTDAVRVKIEQGLSTTGTTNRDMVNSEPVLGGVMNTKEAVSGLKQRLERSPLLSDEQWHVIELARQGKSIFFTGSAGKCYCHFLLSSDVM